VRFSPVALFCCLAAATPCPALPPSAATATPPLKPGPPHVVTVETKHLKVEFAGDRAWTIQRIHLDGALACDNKGFYGTVESEEGGKWIGTGHNDGGVEKVEQVTLTVDGKPRELADKATYPGARAELHKHSTMGPIRLEAEYVVTDTAIVERHRYELTRDAAISTLYAFMHPWPSPTTEWIAEDKDGAALEGKFDNAGNFKLTKDVKWTAIYNPETHLAMLAWYPQPLPGQGVKTGYWDKTVYHKLYNQVYSHAKVGQGTKLETTVVIRGLQADEPQWKAEAKKLAERTSSEFASGALAF
jgi:hypothetical protein